MKQVTLSSILILFTLNLVFGQDQKNYAELIKEAWNLYESKDFLESAKKYSEAFATLNGKGMVNDRYNAACSWALANETDSAFFHIFRLAEIGNYTNLDHITTDKDLYSLHEDERWNKVIDIVKSNKEKSEVNLDKPLVAILDTILQDDQKYRRQINEIAEKFGWESEEMKAHLKSMDVQDSINLIKIEKILNERGWLGADVIGNRGNTTLFLVIQHADHETQKKYLPMIREAVKKGNANAGNLALLEDRVALGKGEKQIYGSQIGRDQETGENYVLPLIDPDNVDKRRAEVGLGSIQDYISNWGMTWDVDEYKKVLCL